MSVVNIKNLKIFSQLETEIVLETVSVSKAITDYSSITCKLLEFYRSQNNCRLSSGDNLGSVAYTHPLRPILRPNDVNYYFKGR